MIYLTTWYPAPPYRFDLLLDLLSRYTYPTLDIARGGGYWRAVQAGDGLALLRVESSELPLLDVYLAARIGDVDASTALDTLRHILHLESDQRAFYDAARADDVLWRVVEPLVGLPPLRTASLFEALTQTIIEQQISWVGAQRAQRWLMEWAGNQIVHDGMKFYAAPTPAQVAAATIDELKPLKITFKRMGLLIGIARQLANDDLDLEGLRYLPPEAAYDELLKLHGIGHWTAVVTLSRAFGYQNDIAHNDVGLQAAVNHYFYGGTGRIPAEMVVHTFARYGEFAGMAANYTLSRWVFDQYQRRVSG